jgi:histidinol-phosphate phosphatase family protein
VINKEKTGDYIRSIKDFEFCSGAIEAINIFKKNFGKIIIVSNQRGVGKKLMTNDDLDSIHEYMLKSIHDAGGKIDAIFFCDSISETDFNRKPNPGMALQATKMFPEIDLEKSVMVGNKKSDMQFAKNTGMFSVFITSTNPEITLPDKDIDLLYNSLIDFALKLID